VKPLVLLGLVVLQAGPTPPLAYLALGWGSDQAVARKQYRDLRKEKDGALCRDDEVYKACLRYRNSKLTEVLLEFAQPVNTLPSLLRELGESPAIEALGDQVTYTWRSEKQVVEAVQEIESAGRTRPGRTISIRMCPPTSAPDAGR
jgi:hypothetical protein